MVVKHARDARMYAWLMALVALSVYTLDRALRRNRWCDWALFLGVLALAVGMHYLIALVLLCYALYLAICWRQLPPAVERVSPGSSRRCLASALPRFLYLAAPRQLRRGNQPPLTGAAHVGAVVECL